MSQHLLKPKVEGTWVAVGFDRPTKRYFLTVLDESTGEDLPVCDEQFRRHDLLHLLDLAARFVEGGEIPSGLVRELKTDAHLNFPASNRVMDWR